MSEFQVEVVTDLNRIKKIRLLALKEAPFAFGTKYAEALAWSDQTWREKFAKTTWFIGSKNGKDIACLSVDEDDRFADAKCWLGGFWIKPEFRGTELIKVMVEATEELCRQRGWIKQGLGVYEGNLRAIKAYEKLGFVRHNTTLPSRSNPNLMYLPMFRVVSQK